MTSVNCVDKLKVLADPTRLSVMDELFHGPRHVNDLARILSVEQSLLSHHLKVLRDAELVIASRLGKGVIYSLPPGTDTRTTEKTIDLGCCCLNFAARHRGDS